MSTLFGLENRSTMDIDSAITATIFEKENIIKMVNSIIHIPLNDHVQFSIQNVDSIRDEDKYGGYRIHLLFEFENIKESLKLDIATGDPITPNAISYQYKTMLDDSVISVWTYNIETVLAEKLETIFSKVEVSSRMKDYYDIYLIYTKYWNHINYDNLENAIKNTFNKRGFHKNIEETFQIIQNSFVLKRRWNGYARKYEYAQNIEYDMIMNCIESIIQMIETVKI